MCKVCFAVIQIGLSQIDDACHLFHVKDKLIFQRHQHKYMPKRLKTTCVHTQTDWGLFLRPVVLATGYTHGPDFCT